MCPFCVSPRFMLAIWGVCGRRCEAGLRSSLLIQMQHLMRTLKRGMTPYLEGILQVASQYWSVSIEAFGHGLCCCGGDVVVGLVVFVVVLVVVVLDVLVLAAAAAAADIVALVLVADVARVVLSLSQLFIVRCALTPFFAAFPVLRNGCKYLWQHVRGYP